MGKVQVDGAIQSIREAVTNPLTTTMTATTETTKADSDDEYLDDVVVRAALERLRRQFEGTHEVESIHTRRFDDFGSEKTDYIKINLREHTTGNGHTLGHIVQEAVNTGMVRIDEINTEREYIRVAPTEN